MPATHARKLFPVLMIILAAACGDRDAAEPEVQSAKGEDGRGNGATLLLGGTIHTMDADRPTASALVFGPGGEILAVGGADGLEREYPDARRLPLDGATVIPGLIDAHAHLMGMGLAQTRADLVGAESLEATLERLREHAADLPAGEWLRGRGWDQNDWPGQAFPSRADLDAVFPERPVWLTRIDGHAGWANSAALERVGRDLSGDWQPEGGHIHRDADGRPTGILVDGAMALVAEQIPDPGAQLRRKALGLALERTASLGLTGVHDAGVAWPNLQLYLERAEQGRLPLRVYAMADGDARTLAELCERGPVRGPNGRVVARSLKLYADGALGSRGAAMLEPYTDARDTTGLLFHDDAELEALVRKGMECDLQVAVHAIGDAANAQVLDAYAAVMPAVPDNPGRHRVEHAQIVRLDDIPRFAELGLVASMQPTHATSDMPWAEQRVGAERIQGAYAWQRFLDAGVPLALGSDFPVESVNPMLGIYAAVTRQDADGNPDGGWYPDQRLTRQQALHGFTLGAAYAAFMEDDVGSLEPGKRADFVVLDRDIMNVPAERIPDTQVLSTWIDGERVHSKAAE